MYKVLIDDNFHYMDEDERHEHATFPTAEEAVAACRRLVDAWLVRNHKPSVTATELYEQYRSFGEDPFVVSPPGGEDVKFSAWGYARERALALCGK
jgi:hypothetical protein